jgi:hypothetical protein
MTITASATVPRVGGKARRRPASRLLPRSGPREPRRHLEPDTVVLCWQHAFDATDRALTAASGFLPDSALRQERSALKQERQQTATMLADLARLAQRPARPVSPASRQAALPFALRITD